MDERSSVLPTDPFDLRLSGLMNGNSVHTPVAALQDIDPYGNSTSYQVQTVRTELGATVFVTQVAAKDFKRYVLPPKVLALIDRQRDATTAQIRRINGKRLAERRPPPTFTPEMRAKALATRRNKAAQRRRRRG